MPQIRRGSNIFESGGLIAPDKQTSQYFLGTMGCAHHVAENRLKELVTRKHFASAKLNGSGLMNTADDTCAQSGSGLSVLIRSG
jgi:hypothetical protein